MSELPEGWEQVTLPEVCDINPPKPPPDALPANAPVTFVPMPAVDADAGAITAPQMRPFSEVRRGFTAFRTSDVIMAKITPCMENGKAAIVGELQNRLGFGSTEFHVLRSTGAVLPEYVYHFIRQESFRNAAEAEMTGSVGQKRVPASFLEQAEIPLPPLAEQRRMVAKVEALLARVNAARARLAHVPALLKRFRQSVLAAACAGKLTEDWRVERGTDADSNGELPATWKRIELSELCESFDYGSAKKSEKEGRIPVLRMGNIQNGEIDWSDLVFTSDRDEIGKYRLAPNTVLFNRTNSPELVGKTAIYRGERPAIFAGYLIRILHGAQLDPRYLNYCLNTPEFKAYCSDVRTDGVSQSNINAKKLAAYEIPWCDLAEQREIVRRVEGLMGLAAAIEQRLCAATARADQLTPAILGQAFRGELVPPACRQAGKTPDTLPPPRPGVWFVYVIECENGSFYKGFTDDLPRRWRQHVAGTAAEWTKQHPPKQVYYWEECYSETSAVKREQYLKTGIGREWFKHVVVDRPEAWEPASALLERIRAEREKPKAGRTVRARR